MKLTRVDLLESLFWIPFNIFLLRGLSLTWLDWRFWVIILSTGGWGIYKYYKGLGKDRN